MANGEWSGQQPTANSFYSLSVNQYRISFTNNKAAEIVFTTAFLFRLHLPLWERKRNGVKSIPIIKCVPSSVACKHTHTQRAEEGDSDSPQLRLMSVFKWSTLWGETCWAQLESSRHGNLPAPAFVALENDYVCWWRCQHARGCSMWFPQGYRAIYRNILIPSPHFSPLIVSCGALNRFQFSDNFGLLFFICSTISPLDEAFTRHIRHLSQHSAGVIWFRFRFFPKIFVPFLFPDFFGFFSAWHVIRMQMRKRAVFKWGTQREQMKLGWHGGSSLQHFHGILCSLKCDIVGIVV